MRLNLLYVVVYTLTISTSFLLGLMVFLKGKQRSVNLLFGLYIIALIIWILSNFFADAFLDPAVTLFWTKMGLVGPLLVSPVFLHLSYIFPSGKSTKLKTILLWILPLLAILLTPTDLNIKTADIESWGTNYHPGPLYVFSSLLIVGYISWGIINLIRKINGSPPHVKAQLKLISVGSVITLIIAILTGAILPLQGNSRLAILAPCSTLILFGTFGYAIIKHKFLDINYLIFRAVSFTLITSIISVFYALFLFNGLILFPESFRIYASVLAALFLTFTYPTIKNVVESATKNVFYRQPYSSDQLLERLGELLRSTLSLHTLARGVLSELDATLQPTFCYIVTATKTGLKTISAGDPTSTMSDSTFFDLSKICQNYSVLIFDYLEESHEKTLLRQLNAAALIPIQVKSSLHGFLVLGDKSSGNIYSNQDIDVLEILAPQLSIAIQNAKSYEEISQFNHTLKQEIDKATADLINANTHLKRLDKLKDEFVFFATHELKNPITILRGYLSLIYEGVYGQIPDPFLEPLGQMKASNQQLADLVNDLLQIARSEAKTVTVKADSINLITTINTVLTPLTVSASQKNLTLKYCPPESLPNVKADHQRLTEILNNLIGNAIKYSTHGTITISHELKADQVITHIQDQGIGISEADQKRLFTRFYRVEEEVAKNIPGTGLGLFIVKQLVEKMNGKIWVSSQKDVGSTFSFSLPID